MKLGRPTIGRILLMMLVAVLLLGGVASVTRALGPSAVFAQSDEDSDRGDREDGRDRGDHGDRDRDGHGDRGGRGDYDGRGGRGHRGFGGFWILGGIIRLLLIALIIALILRFTNIRSWWQGRQNRGDDDEPPAEKGPAVPPEPTSSDVEPDSSEPNNADTSTDA